jgi:hypothetical protein
MYTLHTLARHKVDVCFAQLQSMDMVPKSKMWKFYRSICAAWVQLDTEFIECRRLNKVTPKYTELAQNLDDCITVFNQYSIIAVLTYA